MTRRTKWAIMIGALVAMVAMSAGIAIAGGALGSDTERQAFLADAAKRLDVTPAELQTALQGAYDDRIDAAVAAGKITKEQAEAMKKRAKDGRLPPFRGGHHRGFGGEGGPGHHGGPGHPGAPLAAASSYLGLSEAELRTELESGKTLAQIARAQGKSVDDLTAKLSAELTTKLDAAVDAGRLTQAQADEMLSRMTAHLGAMINGTAGPGHPHCDGPGWGGLPPGDTAPPAAFTPLAPAGSAA